LYLLIFQIFQGKWTHHQYSSEENEDPKNKDLRSRTPKHENKDPKTWRNEKFSFSKESTDPLFLSFPKTNERVCEKTEIYRYIL